MVVTLVVAEKAETGAGSWSLLVKGGERKDEGGASLKDAASAGA